MRLGFKLKHYFFNAFREFIVHHHNSLEFRARLFALIIAADETSNVDDFTMIKDMGLKIYSQDEDRAKLLFLTTQEIVEKLREKPDQNVDKLISSIQHELKVIPRYAKKIDTQTLRPLLSLTKDSDTLAYQENILLFLDRLKDDILHTKKDEIKESEKLVNQQKIK